MKKDYRQELNQIEENQREVEQDFRHFIMVGLPLIILAIVTLVCLFTITITP